MTVRLGEAEWNGQRARFSAALPADALQKALTEAKRVFAARSVSAGR